MSTPSMFAKGQPSFVASSMPLPLQERITSFRQQMAEAGELDPERGQRIKERREALGMTEWALWEKMCELGGPKKDGSPYVSYRMVQRYAQGGRPSHARLKVLAEALDTTPDFIMRGGDRRQPRPARAIDNDLAERLARIEEYMESPAAVDRLEGDVAERIDEMDAKLDQMRRTLGEASDERLAFAAEASAQLAEQNVVLGELRDAITEIAKAVAGLNAMIEREERATERADDAAGRLAEAVEQAATALRSGPRSPARASSKPVSKKPASRNPRASSPDRP